MRPLERTENGWKDHWSSNVYSTQLEFIDFAFRQNYEHKYAYDEETMIRILRQAGFSKAVRQSYGTSLDLRDDAGPKGSKLVRASTSRQ